MATFFSSTAVTAGQSATAVQYNDLRRDVAQNAGDYALSTGAYNAYVLAISSVITSYLTGQKFRMKASFANTGSAVVNVNGIGTQTLVKAGGVPLDSGDIPSGAMVEFAYTGSNMQLVSPRATLETTVTTGEALDGTSTPVAVAMSTATATVFKADADNPSRVGFLGFMNTSAALATSVNILSDGIISGFSGLTPGDTYYVSDTAGAISNSPSTTTSILAGLAISATQLLIKRGNKVRAGSISHSAAAGATQNLTVTIGFTPSIILTQFVINSNSDGTDYPYYGNAMFLGTVLAGAWGMACDVGSSVSTPLNIMNSMARANTLSSKNVNSGTAYSHLTHSIPSLSDSGFTSRVVNTTDAGGGRTCAADIYYLAIE